MSKNNKRDKPYKHFAANYFSWRYCWGGHYLKQDEKFATNRAFRKHNKEQADEGLLDYLEEEEIKRNDDGSSRFTWLTSDREWARYWRDIYGKIVYDKEVYDEIDAEDTELRDACGK